MLRRMDSREIAEWRAFFLLRQESQKKPKSSSAQELKALFAHRVVKKE
jgi:hypothetical protein